MDYSLNERELKFAGDEEKKQGSSPNSVGKNRMKL